MLPFSTKLMLIAFIPLAFLIYLSIELYKEKNEKLVQIKAYIDRINQSADITELIDNLQEERKFSFDYAMTNAPRKNLVLQRPKTDKFINKLEKSTDPALFNFTLYTSLSKLNEVRDGIDTANMAPNVVMHYYSNMIFRLNTLNSIPIGSNSYLQPLYKDLASQKLLSEMITYLGIIRSNIYNVLYTKKYMIETLMGTVGTHDVYDSYETEFLLKAAPGVVQSYKNIRNNSQLKPTGDYIDTLFKRFSFDTTYDAEKWWTVSNNGINELRQLKKQIWQNVNSQLNGIYKKEIFNQRRSLIFLILIVAFVITIITYTIIMIRSALKELRDAAQKIARGEINLDIKAESKDMIGDLAKSICRIDETNKKLTEAAAAIGKGNFNVTVEPRSEMDILGNAIVQMQKELQQYRQKMEMIVQQRTEELMRSNEDLQQFAHVASHDLKEPLRKIRTFTGRLSDENQNISEKGKTYIDKIQNSSERMSNLLEGILNYSIVNANNQPFEGIDLNKIIEGIKSDLEINILQKNAMINYHQLPDITGIPVLIHQLFYNLIHNSLKFSKENTDPVISITSKMPDNLDLSRMKNPDSESGYVKIEIADNGIGFTEEEIDQLFNVFTRLNSRDKYEGTGLGLALCKKIAERHNGAIYATGKGGEYAIFHILLPK